MANFRALGGGMGSGIEYKSIKDSTSSTARNWETILNDLYSTFSGLSEEEREATIIQRGTSELYHYEGTQRYTTVYRGSSGNLTIIALDFSDKKAYISQNGGTFTEQTTTTAATVSLKKLTII